MGEWVVGRVGGEEKETKGRRRENRNLSPPLLPFVSFSSHVSLSSMSLFV
jgi:hypothetical protein